MLPGEMLQALDLPETGHRMKQLDPSRAMGRSPVKEKQKAATPRVLDGLVDELDHCLALESGHTPEAKVACKRR